MNKQGKIYNRKSGKWVKKTGKVGMKLQINAMRKMPMISLAEAKKRANVAAQKQATRTMAAIQRLRNAKNPNIILPGELWGNYMNRYNRLMANQPKPKPKPTVYNKVNRKAVNFSIQRNAGKDRLKKMFAKKKKLAARPKTPNNMVRNPKTERLVKKNGKIGRAILGL